MERFVFQVIEPFFQHNLEEDRRKERVDKVILELRAFVKGELIPINKELAKKTRELFVAASDIENLKENIDAIEKEGNRLRNEVAFKDNELVKQKVIFQRDLREEEEKCTTLKKELTKTKKNHENEMQKLNYEWKDKLTQTKKALRTEYEKQLQDQRKEHEDTMEQQKQAFHTQKNTIIQENSKDKSKLIKKYEEKIYNMKNESEEREEKLTADFTNKINELTARKGELINKLSNQQLSVRRLTLELEKQVSQHSRFKSQFESTFNQLASIKQRHSEQMQKFSQQFESTKNKMKEKQKEQSDQIQRLEKLLAKTIKQKDMKYQDTVDQMQTQRRVEVDTLRSNMMEERQIALSAFEVKAYDQMFQQIKKYQRLEIQYRELEDRYDTVKGDFQKRIKQMEMEHDVSLTTLQQRKEYQRQLSGQNAKRQFNNLLHKSNLEIRGLKNQHLIDTKNLQKKFQEEKIALSNKLVSQYEAMLAEQRSNTEIQLKQKYIESERKAKAYEKRIVESEKRKNEMKLMMEKMKVEYQLRIEALLGANQRLKTDIQGLYDRILDLQKSKSGLINDYKFQLLLLNNQIDKVKDESKQREDDLRANLNQRVVLKNKEIAKFAEKVKQQTQELVRRNKIRVNALEKEYDQLKRVINQRTSLPEDIEALQTFHAAFLEKQNQLAEQKKKREQLQRELQSKDTIEKVFASKQSFKRLTVLQKMGQTTGNKFFKGRPAQTFT